MTTSHKIGRIEKYNQTKLCETILKSYCTGIILDAGCGHGDEVRFFSGVAEKVVGLDIKSDECWKRKPRNVEFVVGDIRRLPFRSNTVTMLLEKDVLHHIPRKHVVKTIEEMRRVTKLNGEIRLTEANRYHIMPALTQKKFGDNHISRKEILRIKQKNGGTVSSYEIFPTFWPAASPPKSFNDIVWTIIVKLIFVSSKFPPLFSFYKLLIKLKERFGPNLLTYNVVTILNQGYPALICR